MQTNKYIKRLSKRMQRVSIMKLALGTLAVLSVLITASIGMNMSSESHAATTSVPSKFVGGYLENWITLLPRNVPAGNSLLFSAFATINSNGSVAYQPSQNVASLKADIAARNAVGKPTILSVGGAGGAMSGLGTSAQQQAFLNSIEPIIDAYGFSGIDWDIEAGVTISVPGMAATSRALVAKYGPNFAITMAPYGSTEATYKQLAISIRDILTFVGFQFYNDNSAPTPTFVVTKMDTWIRDTGIKPNQFSLGFMPKDDSGKVTSYATMVNIYNTVNAKYPTVRGVWNWAVGDDQTNGWQFVNTMAPVVGSTATPPPPPPAQVPGPTTATIGAITSSTIAVNWSAPTQTNGTITGYRFGWVSQSGLPVPTWQGVEAAPPKPYVLTGLAPNTTYTVWVEAINAAGTGTRTTLTAKTAALPASDTVAPTVTLTAPTNGSLVVVGTQVALTATAADNIGVSKVEFYQGTTLLATDLASPYSVTWNTTGVAAGVKTLTAKAYDAAGNTKTSAAVSITIQVVAPPPSGPMPGDANGDGRVNALDLSVLISHDSQNYPAADFNHDGTVGAADVAILLAKWTW